MKEVFYVVEVKDEKGPCMATGYWALLRKHEDYYFHTYYEVSCFIGDLAFKLDDFEKQKYLSEGRKFLDILSDRVDKNYPIDYRGKKLNEEETGIIHEAISDYWQKR